MSLLSSVPALLLFAAVERRVSDRDGAPLVNVHVIARPRVAWALAALLAATRTYCALLFALALYLQQGLGRSALVSGLTLVPWVAAFGVAGQLVRRLSGPMLARAPAAGCLLLTLAYAAISLARFEAQRGEALLVALLAVGGLGLGINFSALLGHLTNAVPDEYGADLSGVSTTTMLIGGAVSVSAFGTLYLSLASRSGAVHADHAFAVTSAALAGAALLATTAAYRATHPPARAGERSAMPARLP